MGLYFEDQQQSQESQQEIVSSETTNTTNKVDDKKGKGAKILKTKHVYTEEETNKLLEKANELNKKSYSNQRP